ncbi:hypothetical protein QEN19_000742 [Hanseniaspora menglaensis]
MIILITSNVDINKDDNVYNFLHEPFLSGYESHLTKRALMNPFTIINCVDKSVEEKSSIIESNSFFSSNIVCNKNNLVDTVTANFNKNCLLLYDDLELVSENIETLRKRPCFIHLHVEIPLSLIIQIESITDYEIPNFIKSREKKLRKHSLIYKDPSLKITIESESFFNKESFENNYKKQLLEIPIFNYATLLTKQGISSPQRPSWDQYFMQLANLASTRSNCMKRKVGCCIVSKNKVVATGYNGTPRNLTNCFSGGCKRCNDGVGIKNVHTLGTCFCLHAEENALLEAGNMRIDSDCVLYCDTCPCITCSVKIVQAGIGEVVYSQSYNMDSESFAIFEEAGIKIRQFDHGGVKRDYNFLI